MTMVIIPWSSIGFKVWMKGGFEGRILTLSGHSRRIVTNKLELKKGSIVPMENENIPQPLDTLMSQLGISNADLVKASTEQLSFKNVQKGRKGRRLSPNIQEKILTALLTVKPDLKTRRRDLFRYEPDVSVVEQIQSAIQQVQNQKISYPQYIDLLGRAGINRYTVEVAAARTTFYGVAGEAHIEQGSVTISTPLGRYGEAALRSAISDSQKKAIDHATFLKRIHDAGIASYEANVRDRVIRYKGELQSYKEVILPVGAEPEAAPIKIEKKPQVAASAKKEGSDAKKKKKGKLVKISNSVKARKAKKALKSHRIKKRRAKK